MTALITAPQNLPFAVALLVLLIIGLLEGVGMLLGAGISNLLEAIFPDAELMVDGPDLDSPGAFGRLLSWLRVGKVPIIVLLIVFLAGFGISGMLIQTFLFSSVGFMLPAMIASIPAFLMTLPIVRVCGGVLAKVMPKDETSAVSSETFIGRVAIITTGDARCNHAAQGKVKDSFGKQHYLMIEPDNTEEHFKQGSEVLLVRQDGAKFYAIANNNELMSEK